MWRGSITSKDGALQLLLIVDYVFEWARDIYCEDILDELRAEHQGKMVVQQWLVQTRISIPHGCLCQ